MSSGNQTESTRFACRVSTPSDRLGTVPTTQTHCSHGTEGCAALQERVDKLASASAASKEQVDGLEQQVIEPGGWKNAVEGLILLAGSRRSDGGTGTVPTSYTVGTAAMAGKAETAGMSEQPNFEELVDWEGGAGGAGGEGWEARTLSPVRSSGTNAPITVFVSKGSEFGLCPNLHNGLVAQVTGLSQALS